MRKAELPDHLKNVAFDTDSTVRTAFRCGRCAGHLLTLAPGEVMEYDGVRLTTPARTWLDLASMRNSVMTW